MSWTLAAILPVAIWLYLLLARRWFWRLSTFKLSEASSGDEHRIAVVIPARDEASSIDRVVSSWEAQHYDGPLRVFIVDDHSSDGTTEIARRTIGGSSRFQLLTAPEKPPAWTGKLWAVSRGVEAARQFAPDYYLFTDADIVHSPATLRSLIGFAQHGEYEMVSLMVRLHCSSFAERALMPAFVFFFFLLYPPGSRATGAAGGCMLVRADALKRAGGIEIIRDALIDDCALAAVIKGSGGRVYLAPAESSESLREYRTFGEIGHMISRTAFTQLRYSVWLLIGTLAGLLVTYVAPVALAAFGHGMSRVAGLAAWILMSFAYLPTVRYYRTALGWSVALPAIALFYMGATVHSALRYWRGRGGEWKGRTLSLWILLLLVTSHAFAGTAAHWSRSLSHDIHPRIHSREQHRHFPAPHIRHRRSGLRDGPFGPRTVMKTRLPAHCKTDDRFTVVCPPANCAGASEYFQWCESAKTPERRVSSS